MQTNSTNILQNTVCSQTQDAGTKFPEVMRLLFLRVFFSLIALLNLEMLNEILEPDSALMEI